MLELNSVETAYGASQVLFGVDLRIGGGEIVSLLGRNGMGKTTTVRSIMGLTPPKAGEIRFEGKPINNLPSYRIARLGVGLVPEGRQIFPNLSVKENLISTARPGAGGGGWTLDRVYELFPRLKERQRNMGDQLSGGEQQMLAIGRALLTNPKLLILDEATEGLAPAVRSEIWTCIRMLRDMRQSLLIIDSNMEALMAICDHHYVIEKGVVVWNGTSSELRAAPEVKKQYLGV